MSAFIVSYHPLCKTPLGQAAIEQYGFAPYLDGSCRREPDFSSTHPPITSLCRGRQFVPQLSVGDQVLYITVKGRWNEVPEDHWRLVALLRVIEILPSHQAGAQWYIDRGLPIPTNCLVPGNEPLPMGMNAGLPPHAANLEDWNNQYLERVQVPPRFVVTEPVEPPFVVDPSPIWHQTWDQVFGGVVNTQAPRQKTIAEVHSLFHAATGRQPGQALA